VSTTDNTDGPLSVSLMNIGNMTLAHGSPAFSAPVDFQQVTGNTADCSSTFSLGAGVNCNVRVQFVPQASGSLSESFVIADNSLGGNPSTQIITLVGTGARSAPTITLSPSSSTLPAGTVGVAFSQSLAASGGTAPYAYAITGGSLPAGLTLSSGGVLSGTPSSAATSFSFVVTVTDSSSAGQGGPFTGNATYGLTINQGSATVTLGNLAQAYTGSPLPATATTSPVALTVNLTYNGSATAPTAVGSYVVVATISDTNYQGTATGNLVIGKTAATVTLGNLAQAYTGSPLPATAATSPAGLTVSLTYNGNATVPTAAGNYVVVATISDANYQGTATGSLVIRQQKPSLQWATPAPINYGTALTAAQLDATSSVAGSFTFNPSAGTVLGGGANQTLSVTFTPENTVDFSSTTQTVLIAVNQAQAAASISSNANPSFSQSAASFIVTVSSTVGTPTGSVTFLDGKTPLDVSTLSAGVATATISSLSTGTHSISAVYNGDDNFIGAASGTLTQNVIDFGVSSGPGSGTNGGGSSNPGDPTQTVAPGGTATYTISIAPTAGATFPTTTLLTVTGLPQGVTATLTTQGWTQTTITSWSLPANASLKDVSLSFQVPGASANLAPPERLGGSNRMPTLALCLLVLPFARRLRGVGKRLNRMAILLMLAIIGLSGCGVRNGFFGQQQQTYNVTVTISTGALSHSTNLTLTIE
jgi:MBG domain/Bacterial Ig-like domain (group 3)/Putative Ig domain